MKKVVVTGAAGLVGQNLMFALENKYEVVAIDKHRENLKLLKKFHPKVKAIVADITQPGPWQQELKNAEYLITLHAQISALTKQPFIKNNVIATQKIMQLAEQYKVKYLIHLSSSVVISVANDWYTQTKKQAETIVQKTTIPYVMFRPPLMFGPFDEKHLGYIARFMGKLHIAPIPGKGDVIRQPLYVLDMVNVIVSAMKTKPKNKTVNIIGKEKITYKNLLKLINKAAKQTVFYIHIPVKVFGLLMNAYAKITKKPAFTKEQLKALVAGDIFEVTNWEREFNVRYTPLKQAMYVTHRGKYKNVVPQQADYYR